MEKIAFAGCGRIARAVVAGLVKAGHDPQRLYGFSRTGAGARALSEEFGIVPAELDEAVRDAGIVVLAIHPHEAEAALTSLAPRVGHGTLVLSLIASWSTRAIAAALPGRPVIRAVPNTAVGIGSGMTVLSGGPDTNESHVKRVHELFTPLGRVLVMDEELLEAVSAVSGAGPALMAYFVRALAQAGSAQGLRTEDASLLATEAIRSTSALLADPDMTPTSLIDSVASPGGMTVAALSALDQSQVPEAVGQAVEAAVRLSFERMHASAVSNSLRSD